MFKTPACLIFGSGSSLKNNKPHPVVEQMITNGSFFLFVCLFQVRAQTRTDSTRSYESHSSSTISSDAVGGNKPPPPPVKPVKPTIARQPVNQSSEDQSPGKDDEVEDPANKSFLGKVRLIYWFKWINYFLFYSYTNKAAIWGKKSDFMFLSSLALEDFTLVLYQTYSLLLLLFFVFLFFYFLCI